MINEHIKKKHVIYNGIYIGVQNKFKIWFILFYNNIREY
jgi:hypothetical protein